MNACEPNIKLGVAAPREVTSKPQRPLRLQLFFPPHATAHLPTEGIVLASGLFRDEKSPLPAGI